MQFIASGWDTNNETARDVSWKVRNIPTASIYPDHDLTFIESDQGAEYTKFVLHGRGSTNYTDPRSATFYGDLHVEAGTGITSGPGDLTVVGTISSGSITSTGAFQSNTTSGAGIVLNDTDATNQTELNKWVSFQASGTEKGYVGYGTTSNDNLYLSNYSGDVTIAAAGGKINMTSDTDMVSGHFGASAEIGIGDAATAYTTVGHNAADNEGIFWHTTSTNYGIWREAGDWASPSYPPLVINWTTGIKIQGGSGAGGYTYEGVTIESPLNVTQNAVFDGSVEAGTGFSIAGTTTLTAGAADAVRISTDDGYIDIGPMNTSYCHFQTDRARNYFDKEIHADGQIYNYNGGAQDQPYWGKHNHGTGSSLDADLLDGQEGTYYDHRRYTDNDTYLGGYYVSGGSEKPNDTIFGAGKLKIAMLSGTNLGFGGTWNDVLWMSTYTGNDVKASYAIVGNKYSDAMYFARQNYDSTGWGTGHRIFADNYHPNADTWTTARTITLGGDLSGSVSINGSADVTLTSTVANDSHNHTTFTVNGITDLNSISGTGVTTFRPFISEFQAANRSGANYNGGFEVGTKATGYGSQFVFEANSATTPPKFRNKTAGTWGAWQTVLSAGSDISVGSITTTDKVTITNANFDNHLELVRGNDTINLSPSGSQLLCSAGFSPATSNSVDLGRNDKYWQDLWLGTSLKMGGTTVIDSSRNLIAGNSTNVSMDANSSGQVKIEGDGYAGAIAVDGTGMHLYHNSSIRSLILGTNETARLTINGTGAFNFHSNNLSSIGTIASGAISSTGNVTAYASDVRLKTNIKRIESALQKVQLLRGVEFDWRDDVEEKGFNPSMSHETGVIAQEVQEVIPDAVVPAPFDENYLTVQHEKIIPLLIEAVKEQQEQIEELKAIIKEKLNDNH